MSKVHCRGGKNFLEVLKQPGQSLNELKLLPEAPGCLSDLDRETSSALEINIKYEGYLAREMRRIQRYKKSDEQKLPGNIDYNALEEMRSEGREKLARFRPSTMGQARRIAGVNPADLQILEVYLRRGRWPLLSSTLS
jgi:tRNA uridine 5-carboxymethylaminomethyl modification enzyme